MNAEEQLASKIIELYSRSGFGRILKTEIDLAYFRYFLLKNLRSEFREGDRIRYYHINKAEIFRLSIAAGMTESRFKKLLEEDYLLCRTKPELKSFLLDTVNQLRVKKPILQGGLLKLVVPNPITKKYLEDQIFALGSSVEYGQNREILLVELYDFLRLAEVSETAETARLIRENILAKAGLHDHNPALEAFFKELNEVPPSERFRAMAKGLVEKFTGKGADTIVDAILDAVPKPKN